MTCVLEMTNLMTGGLTKAPGESETEVDGLLELWQLHLELGFAICYTPG